VSREAAAPTAEDLRRWRAADEAWRPARLARLRERMAREGVDAWFGTGREAARYLAGFVLGEGEEAVAGDSGRCLVSGDEVVILADSRYHEQAVEECAGARIEESYHDLDERWPRLLAGLRSVGSADGGGAGGTVRRVGIDPARVSHALWDSLATAAPGIDLVPARGWADDLRAVKEPAEIERIAAACRIADAALERLLPEIRIGVAERDLAIALEWDMRTNGAEALAFDVTCLSGPRAALPHGSPGQRSVSEGEVVLFDFGAQVAGYRSDMTRTLFVGEPSPRDLALYALVAEAQQAACEALAAAARAGEAPLNVEVDRAARDVIAAAGHAEQFGHGLGHGIGLATHELPFVSRRAEPAPIPSPSVFSVEPGVYIPGETGVRIEDLVLFDAGRRLFERLTHFPREVTVVG
jgi:Xaa-Pro aminopeptidase